MTKERFYLDYNATAPLCPEFGQKMANGEYPQGNASSQHTSGKNAFAKFCDDRKYIQEFFKLNGEDKKFLLHSGATEAANTFLNLDENSALIYFKSDHSSIRNLMPKLKNHRVKCHEFEIDNDGQFNLDKLIKKISELKHEKANVWLVYTWMNNETGVIWSLDKARKIKEQTQCHIYVDAAQTVGKFKDYKNIPQELDVVTWSGHKFGALKGVGFSIYSKKLNLNPLILGGGQQDNLRSGTINTLGLFSIKEALAQIDDSKINELAKFKNNLMDIILKNKKLQIIPNESSNTICLIHEDKKADLMLIHFDMAALDIGSGAACSSGSFNPSNTLIAMGLEKLAQNSLRISLGFESLLYQDEITKKIQTVVEKL